MEVILVKEILYPIRMGIIMVGLDLVVVGLDMLWIPVYVCIGRRLVQEEPQEKVG